MTLAEHEVVLIPIANIRVINSRTRNTKSHKKITKHIEESGLRRPIIVRKLEIRSGKQEYGLICGEGRMDSLRDLGQDMIPALIADVDAETGYLMSLVENIIRRVPRSLESLDRIKDLKDIGLSDANISERIGYPVHWVTNVLYLLEHGERKLLAAVESGKIPLYMAVEISRAENMQIQDILLKIYDSKGLKRNKISVLRKILESREKSGKSSNNVSYTTPKNVKKSDITEIVKLYEKSVEERKEILTKYKIAKESIEIATLIIKKLITNSEFKDILISEGLDTIPQIILRNTEC